MFFILLKTQLNNRFGITALKSNMKYDKKAFRKQIGMMIAVLFSIIYLAGFYTFLMYKFFGVTLSAGMPELVLIISILATMTVILILGLVFMLGTLFFAKDSEFLATLPVKPTAVFASKFAQVYLNELASSLIFLLPPFLIYGISLGMGVLYYVKAVLILLLVPTIPLLISALLAMLMMNFVSKTRRRDTLLVVISILSIVLVFVGENLLISKVPENGDTQYLVAILSSQTGLINFLGRAFPPSAWATLALVKDGMAGLVPLLNFVCLSVVLLVLTIPLASKIYYKGALSQLETAKRNKPRSGKLNFKRNSPVKAIFIREWKVITRSPIYAMNSLVGIFMGFFIVLMPLFGGSHDADLKGLMDMLTSGFTIYVMLGLAAMMVFTGSVNPAASTAISREGNSFWISKVIPVDFKQQVFSKFIFGYSIAAASAVSVSIGALLGLKVSAVVVITAFMLSLIIYVPLTSISIIIDLLKPKFNWSSETEAIKQNMNSILAMLVDFSAIALYAALTWLMLKFNLADYIIIGVEAVVSIAFGYFAYKYMMNTAEKRYTEIE